MSAQQSSEGVVDRFKLAGTTLESKFRIDRTIAEGGFGIVYAGRHVTLDVPIAVKVLKTPDDFSDKARADFCERFLAEARTIAQIRHPAIVAVLDTGVAAMPNGERAPWMVLEWLEGGTLDAALRARRVPASAQPGPQQQHQQHQQQGGGAAHPASAHPAGAQPMRPRGQSPYDAMSVLRPVFDAIATIHEAGIAHRDIKPENIVLTPGRRGPYAKLLDFGIAKLMERDEGAGSGTTQTRSGMRAFSPSYASPEQVGGARTGPWTDVHALGLILTELLTDMPAYASAETTEVMRDVLSPVRPTPGSKGVHVGPWEPVLARALAFRPEDRFKTAGEFLAALDAAFPPGTWPRHDTPAPVTFGGPTPGGTFPPPPSVSSTPTISARPNSVPPPGSSGLVPIGSLAHAGHTPSGGHALPPPGTTPVFPGATGAAFANAGHPSQPAPPLATQQQGSGSYVGPYPSQQQGGSGSYAGPYPSPPQGSGGSYAGPYPSQQGGGSYAGPFPSQPAPPFAPQQGSGSYVGPYPSQPAPPMQQPAAPYPGAPALASATSFQLPVNRSPLPVILAVLVVLGVVGAGVAGYWLVGRSEPAPGSVTTSAPPTPAAPIAPVPATSAPSPNAPTPAPTPAANAPANTAAAPGAAANGSPGAAGEPGNAAAGSGNTAAAGSGSAAAHAPANPSGANGSATARATQRPATSAPATSAGTNNSARPRSGRGRSTGYTLE